MPPTRALLAPSAFITPISTRRSSTVVAEVAATASAAAPSAARARYLLALYPLVILLCVLLWRSRGTRVLAGLTILTTIAFLAGLWIDPPYPIAPEDNLTYRDFVVLHQQAIALIAHQYPYSTVLTAWPATAELAHPDLGYTRVPIRSVSLDNFALDQIQKAATDPGAYDTALIFSTKWIPPSLNISRATESSDKTYYDFHHDLSPREVANLLHGDIVWYRYVKGEWAAVLRFPRSNEARLTRP
jgi:hypothetical protein